MPRGKISTKGIVFIDDVLKDLCSVLDTEFKERFLEKVKKEEEKRKSQAQSMLADLGKKLKMLRKRSGIYLKEAAKKAGVAISSASYYESGKILPNERYISTILSFSSKNSSKSDDVTKFYLEVMELKRKIEKIKIPRRKKCVEKIVQELV